MLLYYGALTNSRVCCRSPLKSCCRLAPSKWSSSTTEPLSWQTKDRHRRRRRPRATAQSAGGTWAGRPRVSGHGQRVRWWTNAAWNRRGEMNLGDTRENRRVSDDNSLTLFMRNASVSVRHNAIVDVRLRHRRHEIRFLEYLGNCYSWQLQNKPQASPR